jgi:hypothetical protein
VLLAVLALTGTSTASAQEDPGTTTTSVSRADPNSDIIPEPDSGQAPEEAGDRGGVLQLGLLAVILVAVGAIVVLVTRESRRAAGRSR